MHTFENPTDPGAVEAELAGYERHRARTFTAYLFWSTDPAQRAWAEKMAAACTTAAEAYEQYADALRAQVTA